MGSSPKDIVILISGGGSNMAAIAKAAQKQAWQEKLGVRVAAVISNKPEAQGLVVAAGLGLATQVVDHKRFDSREAFDAALQDVIDGYQPALVVLAGFMRILTPGFVQHYAGRLINIHPSLLPAFTGLNTHQRAIDAGCQVAGATVHQVTAELDHGGILAQAVVPVLPGDTANTLAARVLTQEHLIYPQAIRAFFEHAAWPPTNTTFAALPAGTVDTLLKPENKGMLSGILTYQVVAGKMDAAALNQAIADGKGKAMLKTVAGGNLTAMATGGGVMITDEKGASAKVTTADLYQSNGVIHVVDKVLLPK